MTDDCQLTRDRRNARRWHRAYVAIFVGFVAFFLVAGLALFHLVRMELFFGTTLVVCGGSLLTVLGHAIWAME